MGTALTYSHDQAQRIEMSVLAKVYDEVDEQIERSLLAGSPEIALSYGESLLITGHLRGVQLMKLFYELDLVWDKFETDDTIEDAVFKMTGASPRKFDDYKSVYKYILKDHPELIGKPIGGLLGIIVAAREGEFSEEDWEDLARAHDKASMIVIRRRARGIQTLGHQRLVITWERDGQVYVRRGSGGIKHIGWLTRDIEDDDIVAAVLRIIESADVIKR